MSLIDCDFLASQSYEAIKRIIISLKVRSIDDRKHDTSKYYEFDFYIVKIHDETLVIAHFRCEMHVIDDFRAKMLIDINILEFEIIIFDII